MKLDTNCTTMHYSQLRFGSLFILNNTIFIKAIETTSIEFNTANLIEIDNNPLVDVINELHVLY